MSTNPTSGYTSTGHDHTTTDTTANNQGGIIDTVKSYVGLSPSSSRDPATGTTTDATAEPAFGAAVGPNSHSHTNVGAGASEFGATHTGSHTGTGSSGLASSTLGSSNAGAGYTPAPTLNPHDEERAKVVAERATGGVGGSYEGGLNSSSGVRDGRVGDSSSGLGSTGAGIGSGVGLGSSVGHDSSRGSGVGSGVGLGSTGAGIGSGVGHDSSRGSGVGSSAGLGSSSGLGSDSRDTARGSGVGSGVGLDSSRQSGAGLDSSRGSGSVSGSGAGLTSDEPSRAGERSEVQGSEEHTKPHHDSNKTAAKRENESAIPTAGGIKLGEKHWGESDIVPDNPKPRGDENISSSSGQPDRKYTAFP